MKKGLIAVIVIVAIIVVVIILTTGNGKETGQPLGPPAGVTGEPAAQGQKPLAPGMTAEEQRIAEAARRASEEEARRAAPPE